MVGCQDRANVETLYKLVQAFIIAGRNETTFLLGKKDQDKLQAYPPYQTFKQLLNQGLDFKQYYKDYCKQQGAPYKLGTLIDTGLGPKPKFPTPDPDDSLKLSGTTNKGKSKAK